VANTEGHSDKQRIAELFAASAEPEELYFGPEDDVAPGSVQPVIRFNSRGERKISLMRWGFKRENGKLFFNAPCRKHHRGELLGEVVLSSPLHCSSRQFPRVAENSASKKPKFEFTVIGPNSGRAGP
jgi:hypothetical protein